MEPETEHLQDGICQMKVDDESTLCRSSPAPEATAIMIGSSALATDPTAVHTSTVTQKRKTPQSDTIPPTTTAAPIAGRLRRRGGKSAKELSPVVFRQHQQQRFLKEYKSKQRTPELERSESGSSLDYSKTMLWADDDDDEQEAQLQNKKIRTRQSQQRYHRRGAKEYGDMIKSAMEVALSFDEADEPHHPGSSGMSFSHALNPLGFEQETEPSTPSQADIDLDDMMAETVLTSMQINGSTSKNSKRSLSPKPHKSSKRSFTSLRAS